MLAVLWHDSPVNPPDLLVLQSGDADAWDVAFRWLWPAAFAVAQLTLQPYFPNEVEDVAIESLEELVEKIREIKSVEELKPLVASIAHHRAVSLLRERFAKKRGEGKTESLDAPTGEDGNHSEPVSEESSLAKLDQVELACLLRDLQRNLKPEWRAVVGDYFVSALNQREIASKRGLPIGTVGVYLKRAQEVIRKEVERQPKLLKELEAFLR